MPELDDPRPGRSLVQTTFFLESHGEGNSLASALPCPPGPRKLIQSPPNTVVAKNPQAKMAEHASWRFIINFSMEFIFYSSSKPPV
jgi:hypothetical protein